MKNLQSQRPDTTADAAIIGRDLERFFLINTARHYRLLREVVIGKNPGRTEDGWITSEVVRALLVNIAKSEPVVREIQNFLGQPEAPTLSEIAGASPLTKALVGRVDPLLVARISDLLDREEDFAYQFLALLQLNIATLPLEVVDDFGHLRLEELREALDTIAMDLKLLEREPIYEKELKDLELIGRSCRNRLIADYQPLVLSIANRRWHNLTSQLQRESPIKFEDLVQQGRIGLINAIEGFNIRRLVSFASYARPAVEHEISDFIRNNRHAVAMPKAIVADRRRMAQVESQLREELRRDDVETELFDVLGLPWEKFASIRYPFKPGRSLDEPVGEDDSDLILGDTIADPSVNVEATVCAKIMGEKLHEALQALPERDRHVLELRFGLDGKPGLTLMDVGRQLGISRQAVHKIEAGALEKLRDPRLGLVESHG